MQEEKFQDHQDTKICNSRCSYDVVGVFYENVIVNCASILLRYQDKWERVECIRDWL
jgi:hypothetical protein